MGTSITELRKKANLPVKDAGGSTVGEFFKQNEGTIKAVIPQHMTSERILKIALGAIRTTPKLQEATSVSLFGAVVTCAQLGLEPNTPNGHAYLIPFRNNAQNRTDVQVIVGYRGLIDLARRSGQIVSISAHAVYSNDEFSYEYGLDEHCKHVPAIDGDRGEITHFYAVAKLVGGGYAFEVMSRAGVEKIRDNSQNWKTAVKFKSTGKSIWTLHFEEMGRKTLIRRLYKYLPTSIEMARSADLDAKSSAGEAQELDQALTGDFTVVDEEAEMIAPPDGMADDDAPAVDINGEAFNPEIHAGIDRKNGDGSWTKKKGAAKKQAAKKQAAENTTPKDDPLAPCIAAMEAATNIDELNEAREIGNSPDTAEIHGASAVLNRIYILQQERIEGSDDFGNVE